MKRLSIPNTMLLSFFILAVSTLLPASSYCEPSPQEMRIKIFRDGWVKVREIFNVTKSFLLVNLPPDSEVIAVIAEGRPIPFRQEGNILYAELNNITGPQIISVTYYTPSLTSKVGSIWIVKLNYNTSRLIVELPENTTIAGLSQIPSLIMQKGNSIVLEFTSGSVEIRYYMKLSIVEEETGETPTLAEAGQAVNETKEQPAKEQRRSAEQSFVNQSSSGVEAGNKTESPGVGGGGSGVEEGISYLYYLVPLVIALVSVLIFYMKYRVDRYVRISEEEAEIISILRKLGGRAYQSDIIKLSGLPRSTAWRYIRKLEEKGFLRIVKKNRENFIILK